MRQNTIILFLFIGLITYSCDRGSSTDHSSESDKHQPDTVIKTGKIKKSIIKDTIKTKGIIVAPPNSKASVSAPMDGFIKSVRFHIGQHVTKGTLLATLEHPSYVQLQQAYLKAKNELEFYKANFTRQGQLTVENAASVKTMEEAQVKFRTTEVDYLALRQQLRLIGLEPDSINEDGIVSSIAIKAPISGYITAIRASVGKFAHDHEALYEIVNHNRMYLHLQVDEKAIDMLQVDQPVHFRRANNRTATYQAHIYTISKNVDANTGEIGVHARFSENYQDLLPGMTMSAEIITTSGPVHVLPENAIIQEGNNAFAFIVKNDRYEKVMLNTGRSDHANIEIVNLPDSLLDYDFVTRNVHNLVLSQD